MDFYSFVLVGSFGVGVLCSFLVSFDFLVFFCFISLVLFFWFCFWFLFLGFFFSLVLPQPCRQLCGVSPHTPFLSYYCWRMRVPPPTATLTTTPLTTTREWEVSPCCHLLKHKPLLLLLPLLFLNIFLTAREVALSCFPQ